ncbi:MAG: DUF2808 domain-containing protein [Cyanobacteria bacterium J06607_15]
MNFLQPACRWSGIFVASLAIAWGSSNRFLARGVQTADGTVAFESGIRLVDTYATFNGVRVRQAKYYFDLELPEEIGEPLGQVVIQQRTGADDVEFRPEKTEAYLGDHRHREEPLKTTAMRDEATEKITVRFTPPVAPGSKVTIRLKPRSNPDYAGVYLFGVTAFPEGEKAQGMYLGPGRLHFYRGGNSRY